MEQTWWNYMISRIRAAGARSVQRMVLRWCPLRWQYADNAMRDIRHILEHCQVGREQRIHMVLDAYWHYGKKAQNGKVSESAP
jgi:hypothetical protein